MSLIEYDRTLKFAEYQYAARETAIYPYNSAEIYPLLGLVSEIGEFAGKYKKVIRDNKPFEAEDIVSELGDVLWYLTNLAHDMGHDLAEIAEYNIRKLKSRQGRGVLNGSGDHR